MHEFHSIINRPIAVRHTVLMNELSISCCDHVLDVSLHDLSTNEDTCALIAAYL